MAMTMIASASTLQRAGGLGHRKSRAPAYTILEISVEKRKSHPDELKYCSVCMDKLGFYRVRYRCLTVRYCWACFPKGLRRKLRRLYQRGN